MSERKLICDLKSALWAYTLGKRDAVTFAGADPRKACPFRISAKDHHTHWTMGWRGHDFTYMETRDGRTQG